VNGGPLGTLIQYDLPLPARQGLRYKLLGQLQLLLASEPELWIDPPYHERDNWNVTFDRRILYFRDIRDLDDYWERRVKPWETPDGVPLEY
jgi:hypothetical protein